MLGTSSQSYDPRPSPVLKIANLRVGELSMVDRLRSTSVFLFYKKHRARRSVSIVAPYRTKYKFGFAQEISIG